MATWEACWLLFFHSCCAFSFVKALLIHAMEVHSKVTIIIDVVRLLESNTSCHYNIKFPSDLIIPIPKSYNRNISQITIYNIQPLRYLHKYWIQTRRLCLCIDKLIKFPILVLRTNMLHRLHPNWVPPGMSKTIYNIPHYTYLLSSYSSQIHEPLKSATLIEYEIYVFIPIRDIECFMQIQSYLLRADSAMRWVFQGTRPY